MAALQKRAAIFYFPITPLYFVRSGYIVISGGRLGVVGNNSYDWSSMATSNIWGDAGFGAYSLDFNADEVYPSNGPTGRWVGFPLRRQTLFMNLNLFRRNKFNLISPLLFQYRIRSIETF